MPLDRFGRVVAASLFAIALVIAGLVAADAALGVRVVEVDPPDGGDIGSRGGLAVTFAEAMDKESVQARFSIDPPARGSFYWARNRMEFIPTESLRPGTTYTMRIEPGARSAAGQTVRRAVEVHYRVRPAQVLFLSPSTQGSEVWRAPLEVGESPRQLTHSGGRVSDYAASPDGEVILYAATNDLGGSDLWSLDRSTGNSRVRLDCAFDICQHPAWSPDGAWIAYSRQARSDEAAFPDPPRLWTVSWATGETGPVYLDSQILGEYPAWSPDGNRLAFYDRGVTGIRILDLQAGTEQVLPTLMGAVGSWSPDGQQMAFTQLQMGPEQLTIDLYRADLLTNESFRIPIAASGFRDLGAPAWSPTGEWLAISVREGSNALSRQIWLVRPDASEVKVIASDPAYAYGGYRWSPSGDKLILQRYNALDPEAVPETLVWDRATEGMTLVAEDAWLPGWIP